MLTFAGLLAADDRPVGQFIGPWVGLIKDVRDDLLLRSPDKDAQERQRSLERMAVQQSLENLMTFPFISEAVDAGRLELSGAWFSIMEGEMHWLDWDRGVFERVAVD